MHIQSGLQPSGFKWGFGNIVGRFTAILLLVALVCGGVYFGFPYIASAVYVILGMIAYCICVSLLIWSGLKSEGTLRRRKLVAAVVLIIWAGMWLKHTQIRPAPTGTPTQQH